MTGRASAISSDYLYATATLFCCCCFFIPQVVIGVFPPLLSPDRRSSGGLTNWHHVVDTMQHRHSTEESFDDTRLSRFQPQREFVKYTINSRSQEVKCTTVVRGTGRRLPPPPPPHKVYYKGQMVTVQPRTNVRRGPLSSSTSTTSERRSRPLSRENAISSSSSSLQMLSNN
eukprot:m.56590 g.56590  ORF g.56590 m.56590 type:complete len:172 (+) comp11192_c0_seq13:3945-4460(+)